MENGIATANKEKVKIKKPVHYKVVMHNDDFTTMEFVVNILMTIFKKDINTSNISTIYPCFYIDLVHIHIPYEICG